LQAVRSPSARADGSLTRTNTAFTGRGYVCRAFGRKRIWLTEYGYQTNPPDGYLGVSAALQARYLADAAYRACATP
jgi:hypothetical protein